MILFIQNSKKYKLIFSDRKPISGCLALEAKGGMFYKGTWGIFFGVMEMFCIFIVVSGVCKHMFFKNRTNLFYKLSMNFF